MMQVKRNALIACCLLFAAFMFIGLVLHCFGSEVLWSSFAIMAFFYCAVFYLGLSARMSQDAEPSIEETLLAGRSLPLGVALLTMTATWVGGGFINGTAESVAGDGLVWAQAPWGYALSLVFGGLFFARRMRRHRFTTMLDPLEDRYGQRMAGLLYLPALLGEVFWTGAILTALGTMFGLILGIDFSLSIILSALVALAYTSIGGLRAVARTDVLQLGILIFGLFLVLFFVLPADGFRGLYSRYHALKGDAALPWPSATMGNDIYLWWDYALLLILGGIPWHVYFQRVLSSKDEKMAQWLSIGAGGLCILAASPAVAIGMIYATTEWKEGQLDHPDNLALALPYVIQQLTHPVVATIGLGALAAAVMSSVDSSILSASSMGTWNVYRPITGNTDSRQLHVVLKRLIWIIGIAATLIALQVQSVYQLWFLCSDFVYCILFPQLLTALFDKKANPIGSLAGYCVSTILRLGGGVSVMGLDAWIHYPIIGEGQTPNFPFRTTSMVCGLLTIIVVSRITQKVSPPRPLVTRPE